MCRLLRQFRLLGILNFPIHLVLLVKLIIQLALIIMSISKKMKVLNQQILRLHFRRISCQRIWISTIETHFFQIKNNFTDNCDRSGNCVLVTPEHYSILKITGNNNTHTVVAREGYAFPQNREYQNFKNLVAEIDRMIALTMLPGKMVLITIIPCLQLIESLRGVFSSGC